MLVFNLGLVQDLDGAAELLQQPIESLKQCHDSIFHGMLVEEFRCNMAVEVRLIKTLAHESVHTKGVIDNIDYLAVIITAGR